MARNGRRWPEHVSGGSDRMRLASALMMLILITMLMVRFRDPTMWRWAGRVDAPQAQQPDAVEAPSNQTVAAAPAQPAAESAAESNEDKIVGTDLDPDEKESADEEFQAVTDHTTQIGKLDMPAYLRILKWVDGQSEPQLRKRAPTNVSFNDLVQSPDKFRGKLIQVNLNVRRITKYDGPSQRPGPLYEVWGFTRESKVWLYVAVVPELPRGVPTGFDIAENVRLTGYFFKLQDYQDGLGKQGYAPLIVGRLMWQAPADPAMSKNEWLWVVVGICGVGLIGVTAFLISVLRQRFRPKELNWAGRSRPGALTVDEWLDRAKSGDLPHDNSTEDST